MVLLLGLIPASRPDESTADIAKSLGWYPPQLNQYAALAKLTISSNTKVALFEAYATATQPFRNVIENTRLPNAFSTMSKLDQEKTCHLHYAADMIRDLTNGLTKMEQVYACRGFVTAAKLTNKVCPPKLSPGRRTGS